MLGLVNMINTIIADDITTDTDPKLHFTLQLCQIIVVILIGNTLNFTILDNGTIFLKNKGQRVGEVSSKLSRLGVKPVTATK